MHYLTVSFSYKNTNIQMREKLAFNDEEVLNDFYMKLLSHESINEAIILSTCNRVEIMTSVKECERSLEHIFKELSKLTGVAIDELEGRGDVYEDTGAIHHLFSVVSSLDSLVIGETQIVGQVKKAFLHSYENRFCGQKLSRTMHHAFRCAALVRNSTDISKNPISISSVAVAKAKEIFGGSLGGYSAIVVGAGEMAELAAKHLANAGVNLIIINRSLQKAKELAERIEGDVNIEVQPFSDLKKFINRYRLLFSATGAPHTVITKDMVERVDFERHWFDIAVPRDIEDCDCENVNIYAVDDLEDIVNKNKAIREEQAKRAYSIVGKATRDFYKWLQTLAVDPMIKEIRKKAKECYLKELERAVKKGYLPSEYRKQVEKILQQSFNTFLHEPTINLKKIADNPKADTIVQSMQYLFSLNEDNGVEKRLDVYKCEYQIEKDL